MTRCLSFQLLLVTCVFCLSFVFVIRQCPRLQYSWSTALTPVLVSIGHCWWMWYVAPPTDRFPAYADLSFIRSSIDLV